MDLEIQTIVFLLISLIFSMVLHEGMHALMGHWLGDDTAELHGRLTLNPLKSIDPFYTVLLPMFLLLSGNAPIVAAKPVPFNPYKVKFGDFGGALVGLAGPLTNLALAAIVGFGVQLSDGSLSGVTLQFLEFFVYINIIMFAFNMIPFPPLDGSRVLYAFAPEPVQDFMKKIEQAGFAITLMLLYFVIAPLAWPILSEVTDFFMNLFLGYNTF